MGCMMGWRGGEGGRGKGGVYDAMIMIMMMHS